MQKNNENFPRLIPAREAAAMLNVTLSALSQWRLKGVGPRYVRYGTRVRYSVDEILAFIAERTQETARDMKRPGSTR